MSQLVFNPNQADPNRPRVPLAIVTFHDFNDPTRVEPLIKCIQSVQADLPADGVQYIIPVHGFPFYAQQRVQAFRLGDYVGFVDDDDIVVNNGISLSYAAIKSGNYGVAFTDERVVDQAGNTLYIREGTRTYQNVQRNITAIHHFVLLNTQSLINSTFDFTKLYGRIQGVDWSFIKIALNQNGAIHVPEIGYNWTQTPNSVGKSIYPITLPNIDIDRTGDVPVYPIPTPTTTTTKPPIVVIKPTLPKKLPRITIPLDNGKIAFGRQVKPGEK